MTSEPEKLLPGQHWQHVKRGTTYEIIGLGELQMQSDLVDGSSLVIYRGDDRKLWAREESEFLDGRFRLSSPVSGTDGNLRGWRSVPEVPTDDMTRAGMDAKDVAGPAYVEGIWSAMLAFAPASPSTPIPVIAEAGERDDEARMDAWNDFAGEHLTDGKGHAVASVWERCRLAFDAAWPKGWEATNAAAFAALSTPATLDNTAVEVADARVSITEALVEVGFCASIGEAARLVRGGGAYVNGIPADGAITRVSPGDTVSVGKKHNAVFRATVTAKTEKAE